MSAVSILLLAFALAADSFAASVVRGSRLAHPSIKQALVVGAIFAVIQVAMPLLGWQTGTRIRPLVQSIDHWIAFFLLSIIGGKMFFEGMRPGARAGGKSSFTLPALILTAIATSVDALVVGFGFGVLTFSILGILAAIGCVTFLTSVGGFYLGNHLGLGIGRFAEAFAGMILIGLGSRILVTHLDAVTVAP